jgi:hypothetical protein
MNKFAKILPFITGVLAIAAVGVGLGFLIYYMGKSDDAVSRHYQEAVDQANHACDPVKPIKIDYHGSGWSNGPYWKVKCPDGSMRVVLVP